MPRARLTGPLGGAYASRQFAAQEAARGDHRMAAMTRRVAVWSVNRARLRRAERRGNPAKAAAIQRLIQERA